MKIEKEKNLAELTGKDWGDPPTGSNLLSNERYRVRKKKLFELSIPEIELLLKIDFMNDSKFLIPHGLNKIGNSHSAINYEGYSLLIQILANRTFKWHDSIDEIAKTRVSSKNWMNTLNDKFSDAESTSDKLEFYKNSYEVLLDQKILLENVVEWERHLNTKIREN